jgi:hypothetical protein
VITNSFLALVNRFEISSFELFVPTVHSSFRYITFIDSINTTPLYNYCCSRKLLVRILTRVVSASGDSQGSAGHPPSGYGVYTPPSDKCDPDDPRESQCHCQHVVGAGAGALPSWFGKEAVKASFRIVDASMSEPVKRLQTGKGAKASAAGSTSAPKKVPVEYHTFIEVCFGSVHLSILFSFVFCSWRKRWSPESAYLDRLFSLENLCRFCIDDERCIKSKKCK